MELFLLSISEQRTGITFKIHVSRETTMIFQIFHFSENEDIPHIDFSGI